MFQGSITALITPFREGALDEAAFRKLVERQVAEGSHGVVPCGTTGESPTLSHQEHHRVTEICIETVGGKIPVIAGCGSNSTTEAVELVQHAKQAGADASLVVTPYYNKPTQEGLYQHFKTVAEAADLPLIIYNIPGRSVVDMSVETMGRLFKDCSNIVGVKDATGDLSRPLRTYVALGADFCQLSGEDATAVPFLISGGRGCISVTSNVAPKLCAEMHNAYQSGDIVKAQEIQFKLMPVHDAMFCESNPGPAKYAAQLLGLCSDEVRLPLVPISDGSKQRIEAALKGAGLL